MELAPGTRWAVEDHFVGSVVIQVDKVRFPTFGVSLRYYVARDGPSRASLAGMPAWRRALFMLLSKVCATSAEYFCLPRHRVVEIAADAPIRRRLFVSSTAGAAQLRR